MGIPSFRIDGTAAAPCIEYLPPSPDSPFFIRMYLRGSVMDEAMGEPGAARRAIAGAEPASVPLLAPRQVHGVRIVPDAAEFSLPTRPEGDVVLLTRPGVEGSLRFADCFPVIMASQEPRPWIALVHAGHRGVVQNIAGRTCEHLAAEIGADPEHTYCWIGPGIGREHYSRRLDDPWTIKGLAAFNEANLDIQEEVARFDLGAQLRDQLLSSGVRLENICRVPICTFERPDLCYSYRRGDEKCRLFLLARIETSLV